MKKNIGTTDRIIRLGMAALIVILYFAGQLPGTIGVIALIIAAVLALTGLVRFCPAYFPFGVNTLFKRREL